MEINFVKKIIGYDANALCLWAKAQETYNLNQLKEDILNYKKPLSEEQREKQRINMRNYYLARKNDPDYIGKLHFFLKILVFFQNFSKLFGKMPRFSPFFWKRFLQNPEILFFFRR